MANLSKQKQVSLAEARAQVIHQQIRSSDDIKHLLKMYYPEWTKEQIENEFSKIKRIASKENNFTDVKESISNYFRKIKT